MKLLLSFLLLCITLVTVAGNGSLAAKHIPANAEVYICVSSGAKVYHAHKNCHGLDACTHTIKKVTLKEALNDYNRRACKVYY